jgi:CRISPR/Cas system CSM-associated protein Csm3 (group 7 of RAMP superfamily)
MDGLKYDYEVVPPTLAFEFELLLENPSKTDLGLTCLGLSELLGGFFGIGGKRSSGLGRCQLENLHIYALDLTTADIAERAKRLQRYLVGKENKDKFSPVDTPEAFIEQQIGVFLKEVTDAQATN